MIAALPASRFPMGLVLILSTGTDLYTSDCMLSVVGLMEGEVSRSTCAATVPCTAREHACKSAAPDCSAGHSSAVGAAPSSATA